MADEAPSQQQVVYAALRVLEDAGLVVPPRSLLDMSYDELRDMGCRGIGQGYALLWLTDRFASWASRPSEPLVNVIKAGQGSDHHLLAEVARGLHAVGIHDLDDWLPPGDPGWDRP